MAGSKRLTGGGGAGNAGSVTEEQVLSLIPLVDIVGATVTAGEDGTQYVDITPKVESIVAEMELGGAASAASVIAILRANGLTVSPPAPTELTVNNTLDSATWTPAVGYESEMHETSSDNGTSWTNQTASGSKTAVTGDVPTGQFKVRVKAGSNMNAGAIASSTSPFTETGGAPQALTFSTANGLSGSSNAYTNPGGIVAYGGATKKLPVNTDGYIYFRYTSSTQFGLVIGTKAIGTNTADANSLDVIIDIAGDGNVGVRGAQGGEEYPSGGATINSYYRINFTGRGVSPKAQVQRSTDLTNWVNIGSQLNSTNADIYFHMIQFDNSTKSPVTVYGVNLINI